MNNKYRNFYQEIKDFFVRLKWSKRTELIGVSEKEILNFEKKEGIKLGKGYRDYLEFFGNKMRIYHMDYLSYLYNFQAIKSVSDAEMECKSWVTEEENILVRDWKDMIKVKLMEDEGIYKKFSNRQPILIGQYEYANITFTFDEIDEFYLGEWDFEWDGGELKRYTPYISRLRNGYFAGLIPLIRAYSEKHKKPVWDLEEKLKTTNAPKIPWLYFYKELHRRNIPFHSRGKFVQIAYEREKKENRIMGIDEFETECIKYLIEKERIPEMPEIFDPYGALITFREYL